MADPARAFSSDAGRYYHWCHECNFVNDGLPCDEGLTCPSVTTILGNGVPKAWLGKWAAKKAAEYAVANLHKIAKIAEQNPDGAVNVIKVSPWAIRDQAGERGTRIHEYAETGHKDDTGKSWGEKAQYAFIDEFMDRWQPEFLYRECTIYSRTHCYAGTVDGIAYFPKIGKTGIVDYKSGTGIYPEVALQLAAYRYGDFIGMPDGTEVPVPDVDFAAAIHVRPRSLRFLPVQAGPAEFELFLNARRIAEFSTTGSALIGAPIGPDGEAA